MTGIDILQTLVLLSAAYYSVFVLRAFAGLRITVGKGGTDRRVDVVIAARNEERTLPHLLTALTRQDYPKDLLRIIVVDDGSDDRTPDIVRGFVHKDDRFLLCQLERQPVHIPSRKRGRKPEALAKGISASDAEIILTTDADCVPEPGWISTLVTHIHDDVPYAVGPIIEQPSKALFPSLRALEILGLTGMAGGRIGIQRPINSLGGNLAFTRDLYERTGGFDYSKIKSDEETMMHRMMSEGRGKISFAASRAARVVTSSPSSMEGFWNQRKRWGSMHGRFARKTILAELFGVYLSLLIPVISLFLALWDPHLWSSIALFFATKIMTDWIMLRRCDRLFGDGFSVRHFLLAELLHPLYLLAISTVAQFLPYSWKERKVLTVDPSARS